MCTSLFLIHFGACIFIVSTLARTHVGILVGGQPDIQRAAATTDGRAGVPWRLSKAACVRAEQAVSPREQQQQQQQQQRARRGASAPDADVAEYIRGEGA